MQHEEPVRATWRAIKGIALRPLRRGSREILWPPEDIRLGNFLYYWMQAHLRQAEGREVRVLLTPAQEPWLSIFPAIESLVIPRNECRLTDRRSVGLYQGFGVDFSRTQLESFVTEVLLDSPVFVSAIGRNVGTAWSNRLTVNVRRGDYYSYRWRAEFGFDVDAYLHVVMDDLTNRGKRFAEVRIVSDGMDWCRARLGWMGQGVDHLNYAEPGDTDFVSPENIAANNFLELCLSPNLVLTNSTFSYWGAYVSNVVYGSNHESVWAPRFHSRNWKYPERWRAQQLDESWNIIEKIPGGWDS